MPDPCVPVVLLRIDPNPFHHGTLGAARSLGRCGAEVHVVAGETEGPVARSRFVARTHPAPRPGAALSEVAAVLRRVAARVARPAVLIPMDDAGAIAVSRLRATLSELFLLPEQPADLAEYVADKARLPELCRSAGIAHPRTVLPRDEHHAVTAARELGLPAVAKWSRPWLLPPGSGLRSTSLVDSPEEAGRLYRRGRATGGDLLLQKYVAAGPGSDWFVHGYADRHGALHGGGAGTKRYAWPRTAGLTAVGRWDPAPGLCATVGRLVDVLGYRGIFDIDFRVDAATGTPCLLDFNPRPGAQFRLFADGSGLDVVRAQYLDLTDQPLPAARPLPGRTFVVENYAPLSALRALASRRGPLPPEFAWHAQDDPAPARAMAAAWSRHAAHRLLRRTRPAAGAPGAAPGGPAVPAPDGPTVPAAAVRTTTAERKASC